MFFVCDGSGSILAMLPYWYRATSNVGSVFEASWLASHLCDYGEADWYVEDIPMPPKRGGAVYLTYRCYELLSMLLENDE